MISRIHRLRENRDFRRVFQRGQSFATSRLVLYSFPNRLSHYRVGFSVSKKMGNAVVRNRLKRVLRACFYQLEKDLSSVSADFVIICRKPAVDAEFDVLLSDLRKMLNKAKIML
ncbi:ribonuclease P protein component [Alicyclobacillus tolerans]|uniref:Ribonuclease P protein component n=2 Tax=Alicyclobacillus tolerans TaxID=90970 RepID=A0A1M6T4N0_9BACL|nr:MULTISPECIES: ribonuclease P protein component [Alicyclobacillus]MDP9727904.1 ribonuclease P protein component [Alicyclobacillus tengchongensis]SHK51923.1 ribonuclease P protein component [Alicyclobacillus montanus]